MSDQSDNVALSLEHILLGIADSLTEAQATLKNVQPYDQYGRPNTMYELPYLDFKLQVTSEFQNITNETSNSGTVPISSSSWLGDKRRYPEEIISFKPIKTNETTTVQSEIISTITGRFVANIPNQGLPQVFLTTETEKGAIDANWQKYKLTVLLSNSAGERITNSTLELNFDDQGSSLINNGITLAMPVFDKAEDKTDSQGSLTFEISLPIQNYNEGRTFVFMVNAGPISREFSISKA